jgi:hypothetical protein
MHESASSSCYYQLPHVSHLKHSLQSDKKTKAKPNLLARIDISGGRPINTIVRTRTNWTWSSSSNTWTCRIRQQAQNPTGSLSWPSKWPTMDVHVFVAAAFF